MLAIGKWERKWVTKPYFSLWFLFLKCIIPNFEEKKNSNFKKPLGLSLLESDFFTFLGPGKDMCGRGSPCAPSGTLRPSFCGSHPIIQVCMHWELETWFFFSLPSKKMTFFFMVEEVLGNLPLLCRAVIFVICCSYNCSTKLPFFLCSSFYCA